MQAHQLQSAQTSKDLESGRWLERLESGDGEIRR